MLWALSTVLMLLWLLGIATAWTLGGFIHILLVLSLTMILIEVTINHRAAH
jgi:hypothetical protein